MGHWSTLLLQNSPKCSKGPDWPTPGPGCVAPCPFRHCKCQQQKSCRKLSEAAGSCSICCQCTRKHGLQASNASNRVYHAYSCARLRNPSSAWGCPALRSLPAQVAVKSAQRAAALEHKAAGRQPTKGLLPLPHTDPRQLPTGQFLAGMNRRDGRTTKLLVGGPVPSRQLLRPQDQLEARAPC